MIFFIITTGLYSVEKCWFTTGLSGFGVWKFALKRCPDQEPPPWSLNEVITATHIVYMYFVHMPMSSFT